MKPEFIVTACILFLVLVAVATAYFWPSIIQPSPRDSALARTVASEITARFDEFSELRNGGLSLVRVGSVPVAFSRINVTLLIDSSPDDRTTDGNNSINATERAKFEKAIVEWARSIGEAAINQSRTIVVSVRFREGGNRDNQQP